ETNLKQGNFNAANDAARQALQINRDSLAAYQILAEGTEKQNRAETVVWRAQIARLQPRDIDSQLNLASAALRFGQLDAARKALEQLAKSAPFRAGSLRALLNDAIRHNDLKAADRFAQELQLSPQVTFADDLLCLDFYKKLDQKKLATLLEKVKPLAARQPEDLAALMAWMNGNGMSAEVLRWMEKLPPEKTANPPPAIEVADAFAAQKNWSRLRRWTK